MKKKTCFLIEFDRFVSVGVRCNDTGPQTQLFRCERERIDRSVAFTK